MQIGTSLVWFRRDLRLADQAALYHALKNSHCVYCVFVFDREILDVLPSRADRRIEFIHDSIVELDEALRKQGGTLIVRHGVAREEIPALARALKVDAVGQIRPRRSFTAERGGAFATRETDSELHWV